MPYTIQPVLPDNQDENIGNYISVSTNENALKQDFEFLITNKTNEEMELLIQPINALTSPQGVIQYTSQTTEENAELINGDYGLSTYMDVVDKITLQSGENKTVKATVDISGIEGTILGAIAFQTVEEGDIEEQDNVQFKINNESNTIIGTQEIGRAH